MQRRERHGSQLTGRELDRQREAIEPPHDVDEHGRVAGRGREVPSAQPGVLDEGLHARLVPQSGQVPVAGQRQRLQPDDELSPHVERHAGRRSSCTVGATSCSATARSRTASTTCSQLSSTSSAARPVSILATVSGAASPTSRSPSAAATASGTRSPSVTVASRTATLSAPVRSLCSAAACSVSRVLPTAGL